MKPLKRIKFFSAAVATLCVGIIPTASAGARTPADAIEGSAPRFEIPGEYPGLLFGSKTESTTPMARISIARLSLNMAIYKGVTDPIFKKGIGYWPGTALPGLIGNTVLGGHRTSGPRPFYFIERMKIGDPIVVSFKGKKYTYRVTKTRIIKPTDTWILSQNVTKPTLTIFACHPRGSYKQRYVVTAVLKA